MSKTYDRHHIIPRSKCREIGIDPNFEDNVVRVKTSKHRAWHTLFGSQTPEEAIATIQAEWSLSEKGEVEFKRLTNVRFIVRRKVK